MAKRLAVLLSLSCGVFVLGAQADVMMIINLDARFNALNSATVALHPYLVDLTPGTYAVSPVGIAGGGIYDAWSPWPSNSGCLPDHTCTQGWETSFDFSYSGGYFSSSNIRYDSPAEALAHSLFDSPASAGFLAVDHGGTTFTLTASETVSFGVRDCVGCLSDNRGGASVLLQSVTGVPEPASIILLALVCAGLGRKLLRLT